MRLLSGNEMVTVVYASTGNVSKRQALENGATIFDYLGFQPEPWLTGQK